MSPNPRPSPTVYDTLIADNAAYEALIADRMHDLHTSDQNGNIPRLYVHGGDDHAKANLKRCLSTYWDVNAGHKELLEACLTAVDQGSFRAYFEPTLHRRLIFELDPSSSKLPSLIPSHWKPNLTGPNHQYPNSQQFAFPSTTNHGGGIYIYPADKTSWGSTYLGEKPFLVENNAMPGKFMTQSISVVPHNNPVTNTPPGVPMALTSPTTGGNPFKEMLAGANVPSAYGAIQSAPVLDPTQADQMQRAMLILQDYPNKVNQLAEVTAKLQSMYDEVSRHSAEYERMKANETMLASQAAEARQHADRLSKSISELQDEINTLRAEIVNAPQGQANTAEVGRMAIRQLNHTQHPPRLDPHYIEDALDPDIRAYINKRRTLVLAGPSGASKTARVIHACATLKLPMLKFNVTNDSALDALLHTQTIGDENKIIKQEGMLAWALRQKNMVILCDEDDTAPERWKYMKLSLLDPDSRSITLDDGTSMHADPSLTFLFTANNAGQDVTGMYAGSMPTAVLNRVRVISVPRPEKLFVSRVLMGKGNLLKDRAETVANALELLDLELMWHAGNSPR